MKSFISILCVSLLVFFSAVVAAGTITVTHYHTDATGTPVSATNEAGEVIWRKNHTPYGVASGKDGSNRRGYTGHVEEGNGLVYAVARYYNPDLGRFLSVDPVGFNEGNPMSFNRYAYANNNPYKYVDPDGRVIETAWDVANVVMDVSSMYSNITAGNYGAAAIDGAGLVVDVAATVIPGVPGGAGAAIKAGRAADKAVDVAKGTAGGNRAGKPFTNKGRAEIDAANAERNGGANICEGCGTPTVPGKRSERGVTPPGNERQRDHIIPKSAGGNGDPSNGQILCRDCNRTKSNNL